MRAIPVVLPLKLIILLQGAREIRLPNFVLGFTHGPIKTQLDLCCRNRPYEVNGMMGSVQGQIRAPPKLRSGC